jgi:hypothetical protein
MGLGEQSQDGSGADRFFTSFSTLVAKWTGTHWTFVIVVVLVVASLLTIEVDDTNIAISIASLLMVFVLQNTHNRDSATLHLKGWMRSSMPNLEAREDVGRLPDGRTPWSVASSCV